MGGLEFMQGDRRLVWQERLGPWLLPASWLYGSVQHTRRWAYGRGLFPAVRVDRPVVSVGSLLSGGTGKTPLVSLLARRWRGLRVAVLSRGYGGSYTHELQVTLHAPASLAGDEPVLLARTCAADVWVAQNRARLAARLASRYDLFLLDDGYQHLALERFLNICLLPHETPGRLLPSGLWREWPRALRAADLVLGLDAWPAWVDGFYDGPRVVIELRRTAWSGPDGVSPPHGPVFAFCGVARPNRFLDSLGDMELKGHAAWPDHHAYSEADLAQLQEQAQQAGAKSLVTTAKDAVRVRQECLRMPLYWCDLEVHFVEGERDFSDMLDSIPLDS